MVIFVGSANKLEGKVGKEISISASRKILDSVDQEPISLGCSVANPVFVFSTVGKSSKQMICHRLFCGVGTRIMCGATC